MPQVSLRVRVPFVDIDSSQRIHYTAMFRYMELAEHELMRRIGMPYATTLQGIAYPRVHLSCDFRGAIAFDDQLVVDARVERVGASSWTVGFVARHLSGPGQPDVTLGEVQPGEVVAEGRMVIVAMDPSTDRSTALPEELRRALLDADALRS
ncbi:MAG: acyl-CoA thioesterase [Ktedonobacterales bacterium]